MIGDRALADHQDLCDLAVALSLSDKAQGLDFASAQARQQRWQGRASEACRLLTLTGPLLPLVLQELYQGRVTCAIAQGNSFLQKRVGLSHPLRTVARKHEAACDCDLFCQREAYSMSRRKASPALRGVRYPGPQTEPG